MARLSQTTIVEFLAQKASQDVTYSLLEYMFLNCGNIHFQCQKKQHILGLKKLAQLICNWKAIKANCYNKLLICFLAELVMLLFYYLQVK